MEEDRMSSTTIARDAAIATATTPWAVSGIAAHLIDHQLPIPETIEIKRGTVTLWVTRQQAIAWKRYCDVLSTSHEQKSDHHLHLADMVLHGSCVKVQLRWITFVDHHICDLYDECMSALCACLDVDQPCEGRVEHACSHGMNLCPDHQGLCTECRDDRRQDRTAASQS